MGDEEEGVRAERQVSATWHPASPPVSSQDGLPQILDLLEVPTTASCVYQIVKVPRFRVFVISKKEKRDSRDGIQ